MPIKLNASMTKLDLIFESKGESVAKLEFILTSSSHGFRSESIKMSKPKISKQFYLYIWLLRMDECT
jgi:hypothetical protein